MPGIDLETLRSFESNGHLVLSVYLCLNGWQYQESAYEEFVHQVQTQLAECSAHPECREAIKEDVEIIKLYLRANGHRPYAGLAIFSCAAAFFWRAYPLPVVVPPRITAGHKFDLEPLLASLSVGEPCGVQILEN